MPYNAYWYDMAETLFRLECLEGLRSYTKQKFWFITLSVGVISCLSSCVWLAGIFPPIICNWVILIAQIMGIVLPLLKYGELISALNFMIPEVQKIFHEMETFFLLIDRDTTDNEIADARASFLNRYFELENKYLSELIPKIPKKVTLNAVNQRDRYLTERFLKAKKKVSL